jgi:hypothetical protein
MVLRARVYLSLSAISAPIRTVVFHDIALRCLQKKYDDIIPAMPLACRENRITALFFPLSPDGTAERLKNGS